MYLCYVDESGDCGRNGSNYLILAGASLFCGQWRPVRRQLDDLILKFFPNPPHPTEIHLAELRSGRDVFRALSKQQRQELIRDFCRLTADLLETELRVFAVIADKRWWFAKNPSKTGYDLYLELFEELANRFNLYLRRRYAQSTPTKGIMIGDHHNAALSNSLRDKLNLFYRQGTKWTTFDHVIETMFFLESQMSPGIQIADLCSYSISRLLNHCDDSIVRQIVNVFDREPASSAINPGKWHGIKYIGNDPGVIERIAQLWPNHVPQNNTSNRT